MIPPLVLNRFHFITQPMANGIHFVKTQSKPFAILFYNSIQHWTYDQANQKKVFVFSVCCISTMGTTWAFSLPLWAPALATGGLFIRTFMRPRQKKDPLPIGSDGDILVSPAKYSIPQDVTRLIIRFATADNSAKNIFKKLAILGLVNKAFYELTQREKARILSLNQVELKTEFNFENLFSFLYYFNNLDHILKFAERRELKNLHLETSLSNIQYNNIWITCSKVQYLVLNYCNLGKLGLEKIENCSNLTTLDLSANHIDDSYIEGVSKLTSLTSLILDNNEKFSGKGCSFFTSLNNLTYLSVSCCKINLQGLKNISDIVTLKRLDLDYNAMLSGQIPEQITNVINLEKANFSGCNILDRDLERIAKLTRLSDLNLGGNKHISDHGFKALSSLTALESLDIFDSMLGKSSLEIVLKLPNLIYLNLCSIEMLSEKDVEDFKLKRPKVFVLS